MSNAKHTPGPWFKVDGQSNQVASMTHNAQGVPKGWIEICKTCKDADAQLIAAAPEMYALLHALWAQMDPADKKCWIISELLNQIDTGS